MNSFSKSTFWFPALYMAMKRDEIEDRNSSKVDGVWYSRLKGKDNNYETSLHKHKDYSITPGNNNNNGKLLGFTMSGHWKTLEWEPSGFVLVGGHSLLCTRVIHVSAQGNQGSGNYMQCQGSKPGQLCAKQASFPLDYISGPSQALKGGWWPIHILSTLEDTNK